MKEFSLSYHIEAPDDFDLDKVVDVIIAEVERQSGEIGGSASIEVSKQTRLGIIWDHIKEIWWTIRWGVL